MLGDFIRATLVVLGPTSDPPDLGPEYAQLAKEVKEQWPSQTHRPLADILRGCPGYARIMDLDDAGKIQLVRGIVQYEAQGLRGARKQISWVTSCLLQLLLRTKLAFDEDQLIWLMRTYREHGGDLLYMWPLAQTAIQIERYVKTHGLSMGMRKAIEEFLKWPEFEPNQLRDYQKTALRLRRLLPGGMPGGEVALRLPDNDVLGKHINDALEEFDPELQQSFSDLLHLCLTATGSKPTQKFLKTSKELVERIGNEDFKANVHAWFEFLISQDPVETPGRSPGVIFLHEKNTVLVKGLVWSLSPFQDDVTMDLLGRLAERCFKKIPNIGASSTAVGNACLGILAEADGLFGIAHLSRLRLRLKQPSARKRIESCLAQVANKRGIAPAELEEMAVPDFGLRDGMREEAFGDYTLRLTLTGVGKTELEWIRADGSRQKSDPADVKNDSALSEKLKQLKSIAKQIQMQSSGQRDRVDRMFLEDRRWNYADFRARYLDHGLMRFLATRLIWILESREGTTTAIYHESAWINADGLEVPVSDETTVRLWHPILSTPAEVLRWRARLEAMELQQPIKQAHREVYLITDAEVETRIYSNRMAAHVLKQHQFHALAAVRGWNHRLVGAFDGGGNDDRLTRELPAYGLRGEYWLGPVDPDSGMTPAGIYLYVTTDQVRFSNASGDPMSLLDVPKIVFSEIMRDVDLFVGVCSVGNDPEWRDAGDRHEGYWERYSFGELGEFAKTRKEILERLLPKLKIRDRVRIDGRFVHVQGKKRQYKIHLGSTNVLLEPDNQYVCIVPARKMSAGADRVYLPFEGDAALSIIISKAILLADDDKITDEVILRQIRT